MERGCHNCCRPEREREAIGRAEEGHCSEGDGVRHSCVERCACELETVSLVFYCLCINKGCLELIGISVPNVFRTA